MILTDCGFWGALDGQLGKARIRPADRRAFDIHRWGGGSHSFANLL